ncbi:diacylglycerol/lipid kinase family protein [Alkaliphilus peptidifermentans]|uniref:Lipid kinase, YegS/Rv2252/BmrU family n=1 Tax=Alkaliphilus peptidifermentans DSM 18978 TaxID=1120976 RepID=A0A1G5I9Q8_9FIRM|nr:diacylglycerol kinase family protein [Alkaliphilus peptidifermentans]SCY72697.1 lipid kinase, YegS/Rv2252/BmrU family [Alkaliphilus peptidifermentans DSM 18978]
MKYLIILNPGSKGGKSQKSFEKILDFFKDNQINFDYRITASLQNAYEISYAENKNYDVIVAVGGDGTINKVINGFFDIEGKRHSNNAIGIIYTGTSPDFCKSYNIPLNIEDAINNIIKPQIKQIKIGRIEFRENNINDGTKTAYFACCANIGLGSKLATYANNGIRKILGDFGGTLVSLIGTLLSYRKKDYRLVVDGETYIYNNVHNISVGITPYIASGIKVHGNIEEMKTQFYILIVKELKLSNVLSVLRAIYTGKIVDNNNFSLLYCKEIEIYDLDKVSEVEFDGDHQGYLECKIEINKDGLDVIVGE